MACVIWNARGLGGPRVFDNLLKIVKLHDPVLFFISESKTTTQFARRWTHSLGFIGCVGVDAEGRSGGLLLFWSNAVGVTLRNMSKGHIDVLVHQEQSTWRFTGFYGKPSVGERYDSWALLRRLKADPLIGDMPWLIGGDFNETLYSTDKEGGLSVSPSRLRQFGDTIDDIGVSVVWAEGPQFTWINRREGNSLIRELLDRFLNNGAWRNAFPDVEVKNSDFFGSDHRAVVIKWEGVESPEKNATPYERRFMFETKWLLEEDYLAKLKDFWSKEGIGVSFTNKLRTSGECLQMWGGGEIKELQKEIGAVRGDIERILNGDANMWDADVLARLEGDLEFLLNKEETHWKQRSRVDWLNSGDRNTGYFHKQASERRQKNWIKEIVDEEGSPHRSRKGICEVISKFYNKLFTSVHASEVDLLGVLDSVEGVVTPDMNKILLSLFTEMEVRKAAFELGPSKAPGPDGFPAIFYQRAWNVVGKDTINYVLSFLNEGKSLQGENPTCITLIPKKKKANQMKDFRPISLCNVSYKIIARAITNRFRGVLGKIIDPFQSAFVSGRLITDNVLVGFECMDWLRKSKSGVGYAALKLDMSKAYDRIEWNYLRALMLKLGFDVRWVNLIMNCVTSVSYSFKVNGSVGGCCIPSRGLRQGDPLSPYLFVLCAQGLSSLIAKKVGANEIVGLKVARASPVISLLFFADDSLVFFKATELSCKNLKICLDRYESASGQMVNYEKSAITFSEHTPARNKQVIQSILNLSVCTGHSMYLGLPTFTLRDKRMQFGYIKDKIAKKVDNWASRFFSDGGKEILIKSVLQAMPTYAMQCFRLPNSLCAEMESLCARFWRGGDSNTKKFPWMSWDNLCKPKEEGGTGFRKFSIFNKALLAKQVWRLIAYPDSLVARVFKSRYYRHEDVMEAYVGSGASFVWRSLCWSRDLLGEELFWRIDKGHDVFIYRDKWIPSLAKGKPSSRIACTSAVARYIGPDASWDEELVNRAFLSFERDVILKTYIGDHGGGDSRYWRKTKKGTFTVQSGYKFYWKKSFNIGVTDGGSNDEVMRRWWRKLWKLSIPPKVRILLWKISHNMLATEGNLMQRYVPIEGQCFLCRKGLATTCHVVFHCSMLKSLWRRMGICEALKRGEGLPPVDLIKLITEELKLLPLDNLAM